MVYDMDGIKNIAAYNLDKYMEQWRDKVILIDVRDENKYIKNHIEHAINIPYNNILEQRAKLPDNKILVLYCDRGGLSITVARYLYQKGYQVINVVGGIRNYRKKL